MVEDRRKEKVICIFHGNYEQNCLFANGKSTEHFVCARVKEMGVKEG